MPSSIPPLSFSKADILSAVETLAWSSLPVIADQAVQKLFFKNIPPNPKIDRTITGLITCAIIILYLPKGSPACIGAPCFYLAYRAALSYWNRKPTPPQTPNPHKPPASAPASKAVAPLPDKKPAATFVSAPIAASSPATREGPPPALPGISSAAKPSEEKAAPPPALEVSATPPAAAQQEPPLPPPSNPSAARVEPKKDEKKPSPSEIQQEMKQLEEQAKLALAQTDRVNREVQQNLKKIHVKVKITYLPQQQTESEPHKKIIPKEPEVIQATLYINPSFIFKFPKEMISTVQSGMKKQYSITESTSFCWVFLTREKTERSRFPFVYFPIEILQSIAKQKKTTSLTIKTEQQVFEMEFLKADCRAIGKCLEKLDNCKRHETIQPEAYLGSLATNTAKDREAVTLKIQASLTITKCYLTPFEKK